VELKGEVVPIDRAQGHSARSARRQLLANE
jgi:hypothetical protein